MLRYLGGGDRWYGDRPVSMFPRRVWEFQAVLSGSISPVFSARPDILRTRTLWLFPPGEAHGWTGEPGKKAEVAVFHFTSVPEPLALLAERTSPIEISLTSENARRIRILVAQARPYLKSPQAGMMICFEHILMELSLLLLQQAGSEVSPTRKRLSIDRVNAVLVWFGERLSDNPNLEDAARANHISSAHLRRLFQEVFQNSPKEIFDQLRFQRAFHLMADPAVKFNTVSEACGFQDPSSFSRAFKNKFGCSPAVWRGLPSQTS